MDVKENKVSRARLISDNILSTHPPTSFLSRRLYQKSRENGNTTLTVAQLCFECKAKKTEFEMKCTSTIETNRELKTSGLCVFLLGYVFLCMLCVCVYVVYWLVFFACMQTTQHSQNTMTKISSTNIDSKTVCRTLVRPRSRNKEEQT